jgi:hypothetical protein
MEVEVDEGYALHPQVRRFVRLAARVTYTQPHRDIVWQQVTIAGMPSWATYGEFHFRPKVRGIEDIETGGKIDLYMPSIAVREDLADEFLMEMIYRALLNFEMHEMQEHFFVDGFKVKDPHRHERPAPVINVPDIFPVSKGLLDKIR